MKAFVYESAHALDAFAIELRDVADPVPLADDLLVSVHATSFNPVDCKVRSVRTGNAAEPIILGWDAAGVVEAVGTAVKGFAPGDEVYYAGNLGRAGSYAERQLVDYRLAAHKPATLDFADAAALPLTTLTAYEALFERGVDYDEGSHALIIGGAGGVGSVAIQLLKALTPATVVAMASRPESVIWAQAMGADHVIGRQLTSELAALSLPALDLIFGTTQTQDYLSDIPCLLRPFGHLVVIDDPAVLDIKPFKQKALSVHWEYMFAKSMHGYRPETQGDILKAMAALVDSGKVQTTRTKTVPASLDQVYDAHVALEGGTALGKMVMTW